MSNTNNMRLSDITFISDSTQNITLVPTLNDKPIENLELYTIKWVLSLYGNNEPIIVKSTENADEIVIKDNEIVINLKSEDTAILDTGTYEQQFIFIIGNVKLRPCYGIINIKNCTKEI